MSLSLPPKGQFAAWVILYGGAVWLMMSKGGESWGNFAWGLAFGVGAAIAVSKIAVPTWQGRLGVIFLWFVACWLLGLALFWGDRDVFGPKSGTLLERLLITLLVTLLPAFPALLALLVWLFKKPRPIPLPLTFTANTDNIENQ